ncbi:uncharacterized protein [Diadema setosum]|uniref:uncharacterized protein n=1 Tax=Diadema setosum TaxID=31175 RepID=UPI003B3A7391
MAVSWIKMEEEDDDENEAAKYSSQWQVMEDITEAEERDTNPCSTSSIPKLEKEREVVVKTYKHPLREECGEAFTSNEDFRQHLTRHGSRHNQESPTPPSDDGDRKVTNMHYSHTIKVASDDKVVLVQRQQLQTNQADGLTVFDDPVNSMYTTETIVKVESSLPGDLQIQASNHDNYHDCDEEYDANPCSTSSIPKLEMEREVVVRTYKLPLCEECGEAFTSSEDFGQHLTRHGSRHTQESPAPPDDAVDTRVQGGADAEKSLASEASSHMQSGPGKLRPLAKVLSMCARTDTSVECNSGSHGNVPLTCSEECRICGGHFANLARHMLLHEGQKIWQCKWCSKDFWTKLGLNKHARIVHPEEVQIHFGQDYVHAPREGEVQNGVPEQFPKPSICHICRKSCGTPYRLKKHMLIHNEEAHAESCLLHGSFPLPSVRGKSSVKQRTLF